MEGWEVESRGGERMNSAAVNSLSPSSGVEGVIEDFLKHFYMWKLVKTYAWGKSTYVTFKVGTFSDPYVKWMQKLARLHGFQLRGYGVIPTAGGELLVTFVLTPRRKGVRE
jgi:hypothetical protein